MKQLVEVTQLIEVELDENKFNDDFMKEFREYFYQFYMIEDHLNHLAQLYSRGIATGYSGSFIEGFGLAKDMGIKFRHIDGWEELA